jgi:hypothetical protein
MQAEAKVHGDVLTVPWAQHRPRRRPLPTLPQVTVTAMPPSWPPMRPAHIATGRSRSILALFRRRWVALSAEGCNISR